MSPSGFQQLQISGLRGKKDKARGGSDIIQEALSPVHQRDEVLGMLVAPAYGGPSSWHQLSEAASSCQAGLRVALASVLTWEMTCHRSYS